MSADPPTTRLRLVTIGHGTASADELGGRLRDAGVESLVDIRIGPGSRRHPHVNRTALIEWLPSYGVRYRWEQRLGGFRPLPVDSPDTALRNESFRGYAAWMRTPDFRAAVDELLEGTATESTVVMCSESVWWRCHRRLVADFVQLARGVPVEHLMPDGRRTPHPPTDGVRLGPDGLLVYEVGHPSLP